MVDRGLLILSAVVKSAKMEYLSPPVQQVRYADCTIRECSITVECVDVRELWERISCCIVMVGKVHVL